MSWVAWGVRMTRATGLPLRPSSNHPRCSRLWGEMPLQAVQQVAVLILEPFLPTWPIDELPHARQCRRQPISIEWAGRREEFMADELSDAAKVRRELLWGMYTDLRLHARHAEILRSNVVNFMIVVASVLIAAIAVDGHVLPSDLLLCLGVACAGLLGLAFAASYTELHERNRLRAMRFRRELDEEFLTGTVTIEGLIEEADAPHKASALHKWSRGITGSTKRFWYLLPGFFVVTGTVLALIAA
jgi:hypothetical protein